jgi:hypothetical protein
MFRYTRVNQLVSSITENEALKTYYTLLLMAETNIEKEAIDTRFWTQFKELDLDEKTFIRKAFQMAEKKLLSITSELRQEFRDFKTELNQAKQAA